MYSTRNLQNSKPNTRYNASKAGLNSAQLNPAGYAPAHCKRMSHPYMESPVTLMVGKPQLPRVAGAAESINRHTAFIYSQGRRNKRGRGTSMTIKYIDERLTPSHAVRREQSVASFSVTILGSISHLAQTLLNHWALDRERA